MAQIMAMGVLLLSSGLASSQALDDLKSLQWKNRIVVIDEIDDPKQVLRLLETKQNEIKERDIVWFVLLKTEVMSNYHGQLAAELSSNIHKKYRLKPGLVILIGKDGGLKSSFEGINLNAIFSDIDAMPMRQQEMR